MTLFEVYVTGNVWLSCIHIIIQITGYVAAMCGSRILQIGKSSCLKNLTCKKICVKENFRTNGACIIFVCFN